MKSQPIVYIFASASIALASCQHHHMHDREQGENNHHHESELLTIHIEDTDAAVLGIDTVRVVSSDFTPTLTLSGEISTPASETAVITAPTSGTVLLKPDAVSGARVARGSVVATIDATRVAGADKQSQAEAALRAAHEEYERLKPLRDRGLVTASQLNAAREAYEIARAALPDKAATRTATSPVAGTLMAVDVANGAYVEAGAPIAKVVNSGRLTLRAFLPDRRAGAVSDNPTVSIVLPGADAAINLANYNLKQLSGAEAASEGGYIPLVYTFDNPGISAGLTAAKVYIGTGQPLRVLTVPVSALTEELGQYFVYRVTSPEHYLKTPVTLGSTNGTVTEITSGLTDGDVIVGRGAPMVRMAQAQSAPVQGHSHNH